MADENTLKRARDDALPTDSDGTAQCTLSTDQIKSKVAARESARKNKDWGAADALRDEIKGAGVGIWDNDRVWTTPDGRLGILFDPADGKLRDETVQALTGYRQKLRAQKDWAKADVIRDELRQQGFDIDDKTCSWSGSDGSRGYFQAPPGQIPAMSAQSPMGSPMGAAAAPMPAASMAGAGMLSDTELYVLLHHREKARSAMDMGGATAITNILFRHGVGVDDAMSTYQTQDGSGRGGQMAPFRFGWQPGMQGGGMSAMGGFAAAPQYGGNQYAASPVAAQSYTDPSFAAYGMQQAMPQGMGQPAQTGSGGAIQEMVNNWQHTRARRDWAAADTIRAEIRAKGVRLMDDERKWVGPNGESGDYPVT